MTSDVTSAETLSWVTNLIKILGSPFTNNKNSKGRCQRPNKSVILKNYINYSLFQITNQPDRNFLTEEEERIKFKRFHEMPLLFLIF